jgi:glycosyltransferase involved in cell wall biosynthesis
MSFSLIISTHNKAESLQRTLGSIRRLLIPPGMTGELIVVDNDSTDDTCSLIENLQHFPIPVSYIFEPVRGVATARNSGMKAAKGDILLFTDDDLLLDPGWLAGMTAPLLQNQADIVAGRVTMAPYLHRPWQGSIHERWSERAWVLSAQCWTGCPVSTQSWVPAGWGSPKTHCLATRQRPPASGFAALRVSLSTILMKAACCARTLSRMRRSLGNHPPTLLIIGNMKRCR